MKPKIRIRHQYIHLPHSILYIEVTSATVTMTTPIALLMEVTLRMKTLLRIVIRIKKQIKEIREKGALHPNLLKTKTVPRMEVRTALLGNITINIQR